METTGLSGTRPCRVAVFSLGGTISSVTDTTGAVPRLSAAELITALPARPGIEVVPVTTSTVASSELRIEDVVQLARAIRAELAGNSDAAVVLQGTDTIEEAVFGLDLLLGGQYPVVVTGAMRHADAPGADGPANLLDAVTVAASPAAAGLGPLVVFNGKVHAAVLVRKAHTSSPAAFESPTLGPIGWLSEGRAGLPWSVRRPAITAVDAGPAEIPPVALLPVPLGDDGRILPRLVELGYRGLVIEALGGGHVPRRLVPALAELARQLPVIFASRTAAGEVLRGTYGFPGSESDLVAHGLHPSGVLTGPKARLLLALHLGGYLPQRLASLLANYSS